MIPPVVAGNRAPRSSRSLGRVSVAAMVICAGAVAATLLFGSLWSGCGAEAVGGEWVGVARGELVLGVDLNGTLKAIDSELLGPPAVPRTWRFKIARMAPEGMDAREGQPVLAFDATELRQELERKQNEADSAGKELERHRSDTAMEREDDALALAKAEANRRKAELKADQPEGLTPILEIKLAELDLALATTEVAYRRRRAELGMRRDRATLKGMRDRYERAASRVAEIQAMVGRMRVRAPRAGTVVHVSNRNGEKTKVGDTVWRMQKVIEIVGLSKMEGLGEVDEVNASRVAVGQKVSFRLDAAPDFELHGKVESIVQTVQRQAPQNPLKVVRMVLSMEENEAVQMRPGMRFRGVVETERVQEVLLIPVAAISVTPSGPVVMRRTARGAESVAVKLGRRNQELAEVLSGLAEGDRVLQYGESETSGRNEE